MARPGPGTLESPQLLLDAVREFTEADATNQPG